MLTPQQQQDMINVAKMIDPMYLWSGSLDEFTPTPTPSTYSYILEKINNQNVMERAAVMTTMPLYLPHVPYVVPVLDHAYLNLMYEKELFLNGTDILFDASNPHTRPEMRINWNFMNALPHLFVLGRQFAWILSFILSDKHVTVGNAISLKTDEIAKLIATQEKIEEIELSIEGLLSCVLAIELIDNLLEQYVKEDVKPKYLYSWDIIESYYWQRHRPLDQYYQSSYQIGAVSAGIISQEQYLQSYGFRGIVDFELLSPRYVEVPDLIFQNSANVQKQVMVEKLVNIAAIKNIRIMDKKLLDAAWEVKALRGTIRMKSLIGISRLRAALLKIAKDQLIPDDFIFFMTKEEIKKDPKLFIEQAGQRKDAYEKNMKVPLPTLITRDVVVKMTAIHEKGEKAIGSAVAAGEVMGKILYVKTSEMDPKELENFIVVFPDASPAYSMLYRHAKGIIFQSGGAMSHGAIVAREYRIPAITLGGHELSWEPNTEIALNGTDGTAVIL